MLDERATRCLGYWYVLASFPGQLPARCRSTPDRGPLSFVPDCVHFRKGCDAIRFLRASAIHAPGAAFGKRSPCAPGTGVVPASVSGTAEPKAIQSLARLRRWFLTPSARKGTRVNSACAYGARRDCNQVLATKEPTRECVPGVGLANPLAVRAQQSRIHPQKRAEDHRKIGATLSGISDQTSVSFCVLLWMHCRFACCQNMRRIERHHHVTTT